MKEIKTIGVVGAGVMGSGIAQVCAQKGFEVILFDIDEHQVNKGICRITGNLEKLVDKGKIENEEKVAAINKISGVYSLELMEKADIVIEAIFEKESLKTELFRKLDGICPKKVIFASNTSAISITKLAACTQRPKKFVGLHFMNPAQIMPLVEVIRGLRTSNQTMKAAMELGQKLGKMPLESRDSPGFIVNRVLMPMVNEAIFALYEKVADAKTIDEAMKLGTNQKIGPLELADLIGLDICLAIMETFYQDFNDSKYRPCPLLRQYVNAGFLGRKTGRGFYKY